MPDSITPVGTQSHYDPMQGINMLSGVLGLQQQQQQLQIGRARLPGIQAESQQETQKNQELQALHEFAAKASQDPSYHNSDGSLNATKFQANASQVAPTYGQEYIGQATTNANGAIENRKALLGLTNEQRTTIGNLAGAFAAKPDASEDDFDNMIEQARSVSDDPAYQRMINRTLRQAPRTADMPTDQAAHALRQYGRGIALATGAGSASQSNPDVQPFQSRRGIEMRQANPQSPMGVGPVGGVPAVNTAAPGIVSYPSGQIGVANEPGGRGGASGSGAPGHIPAQHTASDDAPPPNAPTAIQNNFKQATAAAAAHQQETHANDAAYGTNMATMQSIRHLVEGGTKSGPGTAEYNRLVGTFATRFGGLKGVSDSQLLGAYLDRQAALLRTQQGLPETNMGQATASSISGNTEYNPEVIKEKNNLNEALAEGLHQYRQGLDRVAGFSGNPSPKVVGAFRSAWADNFDPTAEAYRLALRRGDTETANTIKSRYSSEQLKDLARKGRNMDLLSQGKMPNGG